MKKYIIIFIFLAKIFISGLCISNLNKIIALLDRGNISNETTINQLNSLVEKLSVQEKDIKTKKITEFLIYTQKSNGEFILDVKNALRDFEEALIWEFWLFVLLFIIFLIYTKRSVMAKVRT
jgi:hypothetical protein